jgi:hypothetical protein
MIMNVLTGTHTFDSIGTMLYAIFQSVIVVYNELLPQSTQPPKTYQNRWTLVHLLGMIKTVITSPSYPTGDRTKIATNVWALLWLFRRCQTRLVDKISSTLQEGIDRMNGSGNVYEIFTDTSWQMMTIGDLTGHAGWTWFHYASVPQTTITLVSARTYERRDRFE